MKQKDSRFKSDIVIDSYLQDTNVISARIVVFFVISFILLSVLVFRVYYLQSIQYQKFSTLARDNRIEIQALIPKRGQIYDETGVLLARNNTFYSIKIVPDQVDNFDKLFAKMGQFIDFTEKDIDKFNKLRHRYSRFDEVTFLEQINDETIAKFSARQFLFPGVYLRGELKRFYDYGYETAHVVGYVGRISDRDLDKIEKEDLTNEQLSKYKKLNYIGKSGIELSYENQLVGDLGYKQIETNVHGKTIRGLDETVAQSGKDLHLSLNLRLQKVALEALGQEKGAVVAIDPKNGNVLVFASNPSYDANLFVQGISHKDYSELNSNPDKPLINRALNGRYAPGSTIKGLMGLAALSKGVTPSKTDYCPGWFILPGSSHRYRCWKHSGHGTVDLRQAIMHSCDVYFYQTAYNLGIDYIHDYLKNFGIGYITDIDLIGESTGTLPNKEWKKEKLGEPWYPGETVIAGIGQGYMLTTPLQLAVTTSVIVNRGKFVVPRLVQGFGKPGSANYVINPVKYKETDLDELNKNVDTDKIFNEVIQAMSDVVNHPRGTASRIKSDNYTIGGKTGTAQVIGIAQGEKYNADMIDKKYHDHALFIGFAPVEKPEIVVATIVENGGSGSRVAAPVVKAVMDAFFSNQFYKPTLEGIYASH